MRRLLPLLFVVCLVPGAASAEGERGVGAFYDSSLLAWVDAIAQALVPRLEGGSELSLEVQCAAGLDERRARRVFVERLGRRLAHESVLLSEPGPSRTHLAVTLSLEEGAAWAVGRLRLPGERDGALAVSWPLDRELEALLAAPHARLGQGQWALDRLGTVPAGVLDLVLLSLDDREGDEVALLSVDGLRTLRFDEGAARPQALGGPWALPGPPHGRFASGWLAPWNDGLALATSSWPAGALDPRTGRGIDGPAGPMLRQPRDAAHPRTLEADALGGADLRLAPVDGALAPVLAGAPARLRDLQIWPGEDAAVWVGHDGRLGGVRPGGGLLEPPAARVGDRIVLGDLDADGRVDLAVTEALGPGEPDRLSLFRLDERGSPLLFQATFEGSLAALALGDLDFDGQPDLLLVEETGSDRAVLWRLERRR